MGRTEWKHSPSKASSLPKQLRPSLSLFLLDRWESNMSALLRGHSDRHQMSGSQSVGHAPFEGCISDVYTVIHNGSEITVME